MAWNRFEERIGNLDQMCQRVREAIDDVDLRLLLAKHLTKRLTPLKALSSGGVHLGQLIHQASAKAIAVRSMIKATTDCAPGDAKLHAVSRHIAELRFALLDVREEVERLRAG